MVRYRKMALAGPGANGVWSEFDGDHVRPLELENILQSPELVVERWRNNGWRKASYRLVEDERVYLLAVERLESEANGLRAKAQRQRDDGQARMEAAREELRQAEERLQGAEADAERREGEAVRLDASAGEIEKQAEPLRADLDARLLAKDRAEDGAVDVARRELAKAGAKR